MAPAAAETVAALGAGEQVVGVGDFVLWPPALAELPRVGAYQAPSVERILDLGADLYVSSAAQASSEAHRRLRDLGVEVLELDGDTFAGVFASIERLGEALGRQEAAAELAAAMRRRLAAVEAAVADAPRRRVLVVVGRQPLFVAAPGSTQHEMLVRAGGVNVVAESGPPYRQVSLEVALERLPEVVVDTSDNRPGALRGRQPGSWGRWEFLPAVQEDRVWWVDPNRLVVAGPRLPEMTELMARLIHPERLGAPAADELGPLRAAGEVPP